MRLAQKIYNAINNTGQKHNYAAVAELTGSTQTSVRQSVQAMIKAGVPLKITKNKGLVSLTLAGHADYFDAIKKAEPIIDLVERVLTDSTRALSAKEIIKLATDAVTKTQIEQSVSYLCNKKGVGVVRTRRNGETLYQLGDVEPVEAIKPVEPCQPINIVGMLFSGNLKGAIAAQKDIDNVRF